MRKGKNIISGEKEEREKTKEGNYKNMPEGGREKKTGGEGEGEKGATREGWSVEGRSEEEEEEGKREWEEEHGRRENRKRDRRNWRRGVER